MSVLPNLVYRFNAIPIKIPASYLLDTGKLLLKFIGRSRSSERANTVLKENQVGEPILSNFSAQNKAIVTNTPWHRWKNEQIDNGTEDNVQRRETRENLRLCKRNYGLHLMLSRKAKSQNTYVRFHIHKGQNLKKIKPCSKCFWYCSKGKHGNATHAWRELPGLGQGLMRGWRGPAKTIVVSIPEAGR